jgi:hypothetical protein
VAARFGLIAGLDRADPERPGEEALGGGQLALGQQDADDLAMLVDCLVEIGPIARRPSLTNHRSRGARRHRRGCLDELAGEPLDPPVIVT